ncbi:MAG: hypothetical protein M3N29_04430 [Chloroflexota bacterium]|nr:hypothetical protein [Chloroflexota bacterium]
MHTIAVVGLLAPLVIVGCATASDPASPSPLDSGPVPADTFGRMVRDAAERANVAQSEVSVLRSEAVTWRDGSLGCPEPGGMYTQALVPGYRVVLAANGQELHFHADRQGHYVLCPPERVEEPAD